MSRISTHTLPNGVRVVLHAGIPVPRAAVAVHVSVGFRHESPAEEGLAHLFEHLMFRGSASLPGGGFGDEVYMSGGQLAGTTHADYTDFVQVVPPTELRRALFRDAERFRAPMFDEGELALQLDSIDQEITHARDLPPLGGFPWPLISRVAFTSRAHQHDGYGDLRALSEIDTTTCRDFFERHYGPDRILVTVSCPHDADEVLGWIHQEFGRIAPRETRDVPMLVEPWPTGPAGEVWTSPGMNVAHTAVALPTPDPATALDDYLATMIVATMLEASGMDGAGGSSTLRARCGIFGPLDTSAPDILLATTVTDPGVSGTAVAEMIVESANALVDAPAEDVIAAAERTAVTAERTNGNILEATRSLGRSMLLFGDPEIAPTLPERVRGVTTAAVRAAAARLGSREPRWTRIEPGPERTRPLSDGRLSTRSNPLPIRHEEASGPRVAPHRVNEPVPHAVRASERRLPCGVRAVAVQESRARPIEVRLRVPVAGVGWQQPGRAVAAWRSAGERAGLTALRTVPGLEVRVECTGQWADVAVSTPRGELHAVCAILAGMLREARSSVVIDAYRPATPDALLNDVLRAGWTAREVGERVLDPNAATLVIVAPGEPIDVLSGVADAFADVDRSSSRPHGVTPPTSFRTVINSVRAERPAGAPTEEYLDLLFAGPEAPLRDDAAARYVATTVLGGYPGSRLAEWCRRFDTRVVDMAAMRDWVGPYPRVSVRIRTPVRLAATATEAVGEELARLADEPPGDDEVRRAARYACNQFHAAFDSPATLADAFRHSLANGRNLDWILQRASLLLGVSPRRVSSAVAMFDEVAHSAVIVGDTHDDAAAELSAKITLARMESVK